MLYNKYRPSDFSEVRGQEDVLMTLQKQSAERKFGHAYLLAGHRGTGKTTIARILSKAVNCENPSANGPCKVCASCLAAKDSMDIIELDAASNNGVDKIKELMAQTKYRPVQLKNKVFIIDEVHNLSTAAFDALLKPLEEPPDFCTFILCTTELHKIPVTVKSRCESYQFHPIDSGPMKERLKEVLSDQGAECEDDALNLIIRGANGGLRDALGLLEQLMTCCEKKITLEAAKRVLGMLDVERILGCLSACIKEDTISALNALDTLLAAGKSPSLIVDTSLQALMDLITVKTTGDKRSVMHSEDYLDTVFELSKQTSFERLYWLSEQYCSTRGALRNSVDKTMDLKLLLIKTSNREIISCDTVELTEEVSALKKEVKHLKEQLAQGNFTQPKQTAPAPAPDMPMNSKAEEGSREGFFDAPEGIVPFARATDAGCTNNGIADGQAHTPPLSGAAGRSGDLPKEGGMQQNRTEEAELSEQDIPAGDETELSASDLFKIFAG